MDLYKLPTDTFYIFLSFAGLSIIIYFITFFFNKYIKLRENIKSLKKNILEDKKSIALFKSRIEYTKELIQLQIQVFKNKYGINVDKSAMISENDKSSIEIPTQIFKSNLQDEFVKDYLQLKEIVMESEKNVSELDFAIKITETELDYVEKDSKILKSLNLISKPVLLFAFSLFLFGIVSWYSKHQYYQDKILKINYKTLKYNSNKSDSTTNKISK